MAITKLSYGYFDHDPVTGDVQYGVYKKYPFPIWERYSEGRVLAVYNKDYRAMSDVYTTATFAKILTEDCQIEEVLVNANFECDVSYGHAEVDATPEVLETVAWIEANKKLKDAFIDHLRRKAFDEAEARRPKVGMMMVVARGRKVPKGTKGIVAFIWEGTRVLLKDPNSDWRNRNTPGTWVDAKNLEPLT